MSVLANTRINQRKANVKSHNTFKGDLPTTSVSVIARIDYIQRFSKQMTVVVDNNPEIYSKVARQYLTNISQESNNQETNVAFVAASNKINDIQMRCRLIEQLFFNTLFDPEQSLAVSILRLAKQSSGSITVIVEHAQALSLQVKYELCQLVDTAKKTQNNINVVLFGSEQAAIEIGQNRSIFDNKTSVVDASNGQVIALDHPRFKNKTSLFQNGRWIKVSLISLFSVLISLIILFAFSEYKSINFASLPITPSTNEKPVMATKEEKVIASKGMLTTTNTLASASDINLALVSPNSSQDLLNLTAKRDDILQALMLTEPSNNNLIEQIEDEVVVSANIKTTSNINNSPDIVLEKANNLTTLPIALNDQYYLTAEEGYVVQITAFSKLSLLESFIHNNKGLDFFSYQKVLNNQKLFVLTTKIFRDKTQAREEITKLPPEIKKLGSFLKSVSTIKSEINIVKQ